jgi:hypothetical protein
MKYSEDGGSFHQHQNLSFIPPPLVGPLSHTQTSYAGWTIPHYQADAHFKLGHVTMQLNSNIYWDVTPFSLVQAHERFEDCFQLQWRRLRYGCSLRLAGFQLYFSSLKMEAEVSSETSANFYKTI